MKMSIKPAEDDVGVVQHSCPVTPPERGVDLPKDDSVMSELRSKRASAAYTRSVARSGRTTTPVRVTAEGSPIRERFDGSANATGSSSAQPNLASVESASIFNLDTSVQALSLNDAPEDNMGEAFETSEFTNPTVVGCGIAVDGVAAATVSVNDVSGYDDLNIVEAVRAHLTTNPLSGRAIIDPRLIRPAAESFFIAEDATSSANRTHASSSTSFSCVAVPVPGSRAQSNSEFQLLTRGFKNKPVYQKLDDIAKRMAAFVLDVRAIDNDPERAHNMISESNSMWVEFHETRRYSILARQFATEQMVPVERGFSIGNYIDRTGEDIFDGATLQQTMLNWRSQLHDMIVQHTDILNELHDLRESALKVLNEMDCQEDHRSCLLSGACSPALVLSRVQFRPGPVREYRHKQFHKVNFGLPLNRPTAIRQAGSSLNQPYDPSCPPGSAYSCDTAIGYHYDFIGVGGQSPPGSPWSDGTTLRSETGANYGYRNESNVEESMDNPTNLNMVQGGGEVTNETTENEATNTNLTNGFLLAPEVRTDPINPMAPAVVPVIPRKRRFGRRPALGFCRTM